MSDVARKLGKEFWQRRMLSGNPLYPYTWVAVYNDGTSLAQLDIVKRNTSRNIDKHKLKHLSILNHPASPIIVEPPYPSAPDDVIIKATVDMSIPLGLNGAEREKHIERGWVCKFGYRYEKEIFLLIIDPGTGCVSTADFDE